MRLMVSRSVRLSKATPRIAMGWRVDREGSASILCCAVSLVQAVTSAVEVSVKPSAYMRLINVSFHLSEMGSVPTCRLTKAKLLVCLGSLPSLDTVFTHYSQNDSPLNFSSV